MENSDIYVVSDAWRVTNIINNGAYGAEESGFITDSKE